jgi:hypothetical protein
MEIEDKLIMTKEEYNQILTDYLSRMGKKNAEIDALTATIAERDAEIERLRLALVYINNFADEDTAYMVEEMQKLARQALDEVNDD